MRQKQQIKQYHASNTQLKIDEMSTSETQSKTTQSSVCSQKQKVKNKKANYT